MSEQENLDHWRDGLKEFDGANQLIILSTFAAVGKPASMLDVGCGTGAMVKTARALGVDACGVDQLVTPDYGQGFWKHNLTQPLDLGRVFGMVVSVEVAEHLPPESADTFVSTLTKHVAPSGLLVFTAAMPGQPGWDHLNCQPAEYWSHKLYDNGLRANMELTYKVMLEWRLTPTQLQYLASNLQVWFRP